MYVKNLCTTKTWCYVDIDLCIVTKSNLINFTSLYFLLPSQPNLSQWG
jgi:hypothetical protein